VHPIVEKPLLVVTRRGLPGRDGAAALGETFEYDGSRGCEVGYVPREEAQVIAPLLDEGALAESCVRRIWETPAEQLVPILSVKIRRGSSAAEVVPPTRRADAARGARATRVESSAPRPGCGCATAALAVALLTLFAVVFGASVSLP
jgi:hypothetical protein